MVTENGAPLSQQAYGRHRKALGLPGGNAVAVGRAIARGTLVASLVGAGGSAKITDAELADREWAENTDLSRAPGTVKAMAEGVTGPSVTGASVTPRSVTAGRQRVPSSLATASAREKNARADLAELEYRAKARELVPARAVEAAWSEMVSQMRTAVLSVPSKAKSMMPHLSHTDLAQLNDLLNQALEGVADKAAADRSNGAAA